MPSKYFRDVLVPMALWNEKSTPSTVLGCIPETCQWDLVQETNTREELSWFVYEEHAGITGRHTNHSVRRTMILTLRHENMGQRARGIRSLLKATQRLLNYSRRCCWHWASMCWEDQILTGKFFNPCQLSPATAEQRACLLERCSATAPSVLAVKGNFNRTPRNGLSEFSLMTAVTRSCIYLFSAIGTCRTLWCCFFSALSFSESPLVSLGFYQRYFDLEVADSVQLRWKVARFSCIMLFFASDIARHLGFMSQISTWEGRYANGIWRNVVFLQFFTWKVVRRFMNVNKIQWLLIYAN